MLGTLVGVAVGLAVAVFLKALDYSIALTGQFHYYFLLLPLALLVSGAMTKYLAPDDEGHGTAMIIDALHKRSGKIKPSTVLVKLAATLITIASGGSAGKEEPGAQIGAGLSSLFGDLLKFDDRDRRKLVICGVSAGFASVFGTPLGGAIFGVEVLFVGGLMYDVLLPAFIAGIVSYQVSAALGITYFYSPLQFVPVFSGFFLAQVIVAGIFFGIVALLLIELFALFKRAAERLPVWAPAKGIIGGAALILLTLIFSTQYPRARIGHDPSHAAGAARRLVRLPLEDRVHEHNVGLWGKRRHHHPYLLYRFHGRRSFRAGIWLEFGDVCGNWSCSRSCGSHQHPHRRQYYIN